jgi:hypothetical protein
LLLRQGQFSVDHQNVCLTVTGAGYWDCCAVQVKHIQALIQITLNSAVLLLLEQCASVRNLNPQVTDRFPRDQFASQAYVESVGRESFERN